MSKKKVLFVDRDGTLIEEPEDGVVDKIQNLRFIPDIIESLKYLKFDEYVFVMVSNQPGLGEGRVDPQGFQEVQQAIFKFLAMEKIFFEDVLICPHYDEDNCNCKKPKVGLLEKYFDQNEVDMDKSFVVGDRHTDVLLAKNMGLKSIRLSKANDPDATFTAVDWKGVTNFILNYSY